MRPTIILILAGLLAGPLAATQLVINEFLASNNAVNTDEFGDYDDWAEVWNPGEAPVDLGGLWASDGGTPWQIPAGQPEITTVAAGGFVVLWFDEEPGQGPLHIDDKLSAGGESVVLYEADGATEIDRRDFEAQTSNVSEGREWNGAPSWVAFATPTPGASNGENALGDPARLPVALEVLEAAPNPFNPAVALRFRLAAALPVELRVSDLAGRLVHAESLGPRPAGEGVASWRPAPGSASGVYVLSLRAGDALTSRTVLYVK